MTEYHASICGTCYERLDRPRQTGFTGSWGFVPCSICGKDHAEWMVAIASSKLSESDKKALDDAQPDWDGT